MFRERFGAEPVVACAPGRVNLIGEHTDYNDGFVMPAAIGFSTCVAAAARSDGRFVAASLQFPEQLDADAHATRERRGDWTDYCWGVWHVLRDAGVALDGVSLLVDGDVPIGAGLSSSAAIEVATAFALFALARAMPLKPELARLCQRAENEFVGARVGIMDQFIACTGRAGHAITLDCRSLDFQYTPVPEGVALVICDTMVKHSITGGEYNQRRAECEEGVRLLRQHLPGIRALRDVTLQTFVHYAHSLPMVIARRCRHVIKENERVLAARDALASGDIAALGPLMRASHESLRDDYAVSCRELDIMVELAAAQRGTVGTRMTGGGFGGCTVNLVRSAEIDAFREAVREGYTRETQLAPEIYVTTAADGVRQL